MEFADCNYVLYQVFAKLVYQNTFLPFLSTKIKKQINIVFKLFVTFNLRE